MADEDVIRLELDLGRSSASTQQLVEQIKYLQERMVVVAQNFRDGAIDEERFIGASKLLTDTLRQKQNVLKAVAGDEGAGTGFAGLSSNVLKGERAFTALATGSGLARAGPMLESLIPLIGGPAGLGFAIIGLSYAFEKIIPLVDEWTKGIIGGMNEIPKSLDSVRRLSDELGKNKEALDKLKSSQSLTNTELREFNRLTEEQARLEKELEAEREKKKTREALAALPKKSDEEAAKERAEILQAAMGEKAGLLPRWLEQAVQFAERKITTAETGEEYKKAVEAFKPFKDLQLPQAREDLIGAAMIKGDPAAIKKLAGLMPGQGFEQALPGAVEAGEEDVRKAEAFGDRATKAGQARRENARKLRERHEATDKNMEQLGKDFMAGQKAGAKQLRAGVEVGKAGEEASKLRDRELAGIGREDTRARQEIARLREDSHQAKMLFGQGLITFEQMQATVGRDQTLFNQLQERIKRIEQRERVLEARQTILKKPN